MLDWRLYVAFLAIAISIVSLIWNWRHSESLFHRTAYPAVAWWRPELSRVKHNTVIKTSICNHGPKDIISISIVAFLCRGFKVAPWCKSEPIKKVPIGEDLTFNITEELEKDINERFGGLSYREGWQFDRKARRYKIIFRLEYQPLIADTSPLIRKAYYFLKPMIENHVIKSWELKPIPTWQGWLPWV
jgi:hypothetical protein